MSGSEEIGVVGYPQDKNLRSECGDCESGAQMYELFDEIEYDRSDNVLKML